MDPIILDYTDVVEVTDATQLVTDDPLGDDYGPYNPATAKGPYMLPTDAAFSGTLDLGQVIAAAEGADADNLGTPTDTSPEVTVDGNTVRLRFDTAAIGNPEDLTAVKVYVATWDWDSEAGALRGLTPQASATTFGGGAGDGAGGRRFAGDRRCAGGGIERLPLALCARAAALPTPRDATPTTAWRTAPTPRRQTTSAR